MTQESFPRAEGSHGTFEEQFNKKEVMEVAGGTAEVLDAFPEGEQKTEVPVFFAPAWACTMEVYKPALETLTQQGRRVISLDHPRRGGDMSAATEEHLETYPREELRKALSLLDIIDQKKLEKVDMIAHSESAVNAVIAATLHPEKIRNLVLFSPAGMIGEDTFSRLLRGFIAQNTRAETLNQREPADENSLGWPEIPVTETEKYVAATAAREGIKYLLANPVRSIQEARGLAKSQIHDMLRYLHGHGVGIVVMATIDDPVFPMDRIQEIAKRDMLDGFLSLRGGHGEIGNHPERYMVAAEQMLTALEEKKKNPKTEDVSV